MSVVTTTKAINPTLFGEELGVGVDFVIRGDGPFDEVNDKEIEVPSLDETALSAAITAHTYAPDAPPAEVTDLAALATKATDVNAGNSTYTDTERDQAIALLILANRDVAAVTNA